MRLFTLVGVIALVAGCNAELGVGGIPPAGPSGTSPGGTTPGGTIPGGTGDGGNSVNCPDGTHASSGQCVADEVTCAAEFPCDTGQTCVGGRCITVPGPCMTNDDCPTGDQCLNGMCVPICPQQNPQCTQDSDCANGGFCVACSCVSASQCAVPTGDLSGQPFTALQDLHLDQALGSFGQTVVGIVKDLRDGIDGCPNGSSSNCWIFQIIGAALPPWAQSLIVFLGDFGDLIDNHDFIIHSTMTFVKAGKPSSYTGTDHWTLLEFSYMNQMIMAKPEDVPQIGQPVIIPFTASAVCGVLYVDKHDVNGVLSGILNWIVSTVVQLETNGQYNSLGDAINGAIDCSQFLFSDPTVFAACEAFTNGLTSKIDDALNQWLLDYSLMTLQGTALVDQPAKNLTDGHWDGTLGSLGGIFNNFDGEWSASR